MADGTHGTGPNNSGSESGNSNAAAGVNAEEIARMVNDAVSKAIGARMKRLNLEEQVAKAVDSALSKIADQPPAQAVAQGAAPAPEAEQPEKLNLKTLDSRFKAIQDELAKERKARQDAEDRATQTRLRADLQATFAKHAGQENPHLPAYLNMYAGQFQHRDGQTYRVVKDEFGDEQLVPLEQAASDMFAGELKHLVAPPPSNNRGLPPTSFARGMPMTPGNNAPNKGGIFEQEIMHHQAMHDPALWQQLYAPKPQK